MVGLGWVMRSLGVCSVVAAAVLFSASPARAGCDCDNPTTNLCERFCNKLKCPVNAGGPSFVQSKDCAPKKFVPAHRVQRVCCTGGTAAKPKVKCKPYPPCKRLSDS